MIALARGNAVGDPRWPWHAADALDGECFIPHQYTRAQPSLANQARLPAVGAGRKPVRSLRKNPVVAVINSFFQPSVFCSRNE